MTIGDKIKFLRKAAGITQHKLSTCTGIHLATIAKYETNKTVPQAAQIAKLADALGVGYYAIAGLEQNFRLETVGDFLGLIILLRKNNILCFKGERDKSNKLNPDTAIIEINPFISQFLNINVNGTIFDKDKITFHLRSNKIINDLFTWEKLYYEFENYISQNEQSITQSEIDKFANDLDIIELELQRSMIIFDATKNGMDAISIKQPKYLDL